MGEVCRMFDPDRDCDCRACRFDASKAWRRAYRAAEVAVGWAFDAVIAVEDVVDRFGSGRPARYDPPPPQGHPAGICTAIITPLDCDDQIEHSNIVVDGWFHASEATCGGDVISRSHLTPEGDE